MLEDIVWEGSISDANGGGVMHIIRNRIGITIGAVDVIQMNSLEIIDFTIFGNKVKSGSATVFKEHISALASSALTENINCSTIFMSVCYRRALTLIVGVIACGTFNTSSSISCVFDTIGVFSVGYF